MRDSAVIFVPPTLSLDGIYAQNCISYALGRGYQLAAVIRDWRQIDQMLQDGRAGVVVVGRGEHWVGEDLGRSEPAGTTQLLPRPEPSRFNDDGIRRVLNGVDPVPAGVAPETVAALRLIWWHLRDRT
jgi:hypothetical protein